MDGIRGWWMQRIRRRGVVLGDLTHVSHGHFYHLYAQHKYVHTAQYVHTAYMLTKQHM